MKNLVESEVSYIYVGTHDEYRLLEASIVPLAVIG